MRERILEVLKLTRNNALSKEEIYKKVYHTEYDDNQYKTLEAHIKDLLDEKSIYCINSKKELYTLNPFKEGIFHIKRNGECYVSTDNDVITIRPDKVFGAMDKDKVLVRITDFNMLEGNIKEIIERSGIIAEVTTIGKDRYAVVGKDKYKIDLDNSIVDGMLIGIKIDTTKAGNYYRCSLDKIIGHKNAPKLDEKKILYNNGVSDEFSKEALQELKSIPNEVQKYDLENRRDLRNKMIFTIDGDDTKDIDDAISLDVLNNGNYKLGVHIADVTHYIKEDSYLDFDARERGTSTYMPGVVNPMYPVQLSNGICSLNPKVDRLTITCEMEFDPEGKLMDFDIFKSIINSNIQMTYKNVNKILDENKVPEGYESFVEALKKMQELALVLRKMRIKRGMLDFGNDELKINVDEKGKVTGIELRVQGTGEKLIEDYMLAANETVATYMFDMGLNSIYRVHDVPDIERLKRALTIIKSYGAKVNIKLKPDDPRCIQELLIELKDDPNYDIYSNMILRCMAKAIYHNINNGHFGIGVNSKKGEAYTHFTSPIRRYPDTTVHRVLSYILSGDIEKVQTDEYKAKLIEIAMHSSEMELVADNCEHEADKMKMADYMSSRIGEEFEGRIISFTKYGMFVKLDNNVEGRLGYNTMDDFYNYNEELELLIGERTKKIYKLGDKIEVRLIKSDKESREIDFELANNKKKEKKFSSNKGVKYGNTEQKSKLQLLRRRNN